jgi:hypothetical protein
MIKKFFAELCYYAINATNKSVGLRRIDDSEGIVKLSAIVFSCMIL